MKFDCFKIINAINKQTITIKYPIIILDLMPNLIFFFHNVPTFILDILLEAFEKHVYFCRWTILLSVHTLHSIFLYLIGLLSFPINSTFLLYTLFLYRRIFIVQEGKINFSSLQISIFKLVYKNRPMLLKA